METLPFRVSVTMLLFMKVYALVEFTHFKTSTNFSDLYCPAKDAQPGIVVSLSDCGNRCSGHGECLGFFYNSTTRACSLRLPYGPDSSVCEPEPDSVYYDRKADPSCVEYMVGQSDQGGVADSQLTASSYWCDTHRGPKIPEHCLKQWYGRLHSMGWHTGAWVPSTIDTVQWIQVDFNEPRVITGIALTGRDPLDGVLEWVTSFRVFTSSNCIDWAVIVNETGSPQVFDGTSGPDVVVERHLTGRVVARCVRVNPVTWIGEHLALRFDVLGCTLF